MYRDTSNSPNKLVYFTRTSPLIHALPAHFPISTFAEDCRDMDAIKKTVAEFVFVETDKLMIHNLSSLLSQSSVQELLKDFVSSEKTQVCLLLANMQETSSKTINHIRVMIEEAELRGRDNNCKLFVLLLHFPPAQFFQYCYPVLFLKGWEYIYMDKIAQSTNKGVVDIKDWFIRCCFPDKESFNETDVLLQSLKQLLPQAISILSARMYFGNKSDGSFNSNMNVTERSNALKILLFEKKMGEVLCEKFCLYWKPKVMTEYLERAATVSKQRESTLSITDSIQTQFKGLFMDFCVYMLTQANKNFNLDIVYDKDLSSPLYKIFIDIFKILPVPKLKQLNLLSNSLHTLKAPVHCPQFPFFNLVCDLMENQVDMNLEASNLRLNILADHTSQERLTNSLLVSGTPNNPEARFQALKTAVLDALQLLPVRMCYCYYCM